MFRRINSPWRCGRQGALGRQQGPGPSKLWWGTVSLGTDLNLAAVKVLWECVWLKKKKKKILTSFPLASVAHLVGGLSCSWKIVGSIHCQGTCLDCGFNPQSGGTIPPTEGSQSMFFSLSLFLSLPLSLKAMKKNVIRWEFEKKF